jgi:hypothetical protein
MNVWLPYGLLALFSFFLARCLQEPLTPTLVVGSLDRLVLEGVLPTDREGEHAMVGSDKVYSLDGRENMEGQLGLAEEDSTHFRWETVGNRLLKFVVSYLNHFPFLV